MPIIYLSPSTQENNFYVNGGTEEEWMNRLADALEPYLTASGIRFNRNTPYMTASSSIRANTTSIWLSIPTLLPKGSMGKSGVFWFSTIPAVARGKPLPNLLQTG